METTLYQVEFKDGRIFRIFCANSTQKRKFKESLIKNGQDCSYKSIVDGIHTEKQFQKILNNA